MQHKITTLDAQPSSPTVSSILVNVTGMLIVSTLLSDIHARSDPIQVDDSQNPLQFSQVFQLVPEGGTYYVCVLPFALHPRLTSHSQQLQRHLPSQLRLMVYFVRMPKLLSRAISCLLPPLTLYAERRSINTYLYRLLLLYNLEFVAGALHTSTRTRNASSHRRDQQVRDTLVGFPPGWCALLLSVS